MGGPSVNKKGQNTSRKKSHSSTRITAQQNILKRLTNKEERLLAGNNVENAQLKYQRIVASAPFPHDQRIRHFDRHIENLKHNIDSLQEAPPPVPAELIEPLVAPHNAPGTSSAPVDALAPTQGEGEPEVADTTTAAAVPKVANDLAPPPLQKMPTL